VRTEELVAKLAADITPVRRLAPVGVRLVRWLTLAALVVGAGVMLVGPRADVVDRLTDSHFVLVLSVLGLLTVSSARAALAMSVPDDGRSPLAVALPLGAGAIWAAVLAVALAAGGSVVAQLDGEPAHAACAFQTAGLAIVPAIALFVMVRAGAATAPSQAGVLVLAAALGAGAVGVALMCPVDRAAHQVVWHFLPVATLAVLGSLAGRAALDRLSR
jgi:hypothetical protein